MVAEKDNVSREMAQVVAPLLVIQGAEDVKELD